MESDNIKEIDEESSKIIKESQPVEIFEGLEDKKRKSKTVFMLIKELASTPSKTKAYNYDYCSIEDLKQCLFEAARTVRDRYFASKIGNLRMFFDVTTKVDIISERDTVCYVTYYVEIYDSITLAVVSSYKNITKFAMATMMLPEEGHKTPQDLMKNKGSWITYISRYALSQTMTITKLGRDPEQEEEIEGLKDSKPEVKKIDPRLVKGIA